MKKKSVNTQKRISEAPESNAGDDYHILWAGLKALELLNFSDDGLKLVSIEGPAPTESIEIDETGEKLLAIDMAEYYGGNTFETAQRIIFSQLKYSERQIQKTYTLARLCEGKRGGIKGSILEKLAKTFKAYYSKYGKKKVTEKLIIKLVSTREISKSLQKDIETIQSYIIGKVKVTKKELLSAYPSLKAMVDKVMTTSKLTFDECMMFLGLLDFSDCSSDKRKLLKHNLLKELSKLNSYEVKRQFNTLNQMVRDKMQPEAIKEMTNTITQEELLTGLLDGRSIDTILPAPPKFNYPNHFIRRKNIQAIANEIIATDKEIICLHGEAGVGKTTIITSLSKYLPDNSVTIIYDCYGQGTYLDDSVIRHTHQNALTQICNEMAPKTGSSLLIPGRFNEYEYVSEFRKRLENAVSILTKSDPNALLTIIIDAADNSVTASETKQDKCFVHSLASLENIPKGCKIVFTARTQRIGSLKLSADTSYKIPIKRFTLQETAQIIKHKYSSVTKEQIIEFHDLTNQNPRVQYYALENRNSLKQVFIFLKPYGKTLENVIKGQIKEAQKKLGNENKVEAILMAIIHLPRPVPIKYVALISDCSELDIMDFCLDLSTGLVLSNNSISFRDENFEWELRDNYPLNIEYSKKLADLFLAEIDKDLYINTHLANVLYNGGRYDELRDIVLGAKNLSIMTDPLKQREVIVTRVRLALKSCSNKEDNATFLKLLFLCAEASKTDKYRLNLIKENIDLASQYLDFNTTQKLFFEITSNIHHGSAHMEFAALLSRATKTELFAEKHLSLLRSWLEMRNRVPKDDLKEYHISEHNVACEIEANLRLYGPAIARRKLLRWSPEELHFKVVRILVRQLIEYSTEDELKEWLKHIKRADILLVVIEKLHKSNISLQIDVQQLAKTIIILLKKNLVDFKSGIDTYLVSFCEYLSEKDIYKELLSELLSLINLPVPEQSISFFSGLNEDNVRKLHNSFRIASLRAVLNKQSLVSADFYPKRLHNEEKSNLEKRQKERNKSDKEEFDRLYSKLLPIYQVRAAVITKTLSGSLTKNLSDVIKKLDSDYALSYQRTDAGNLYKFICNILCDLLPRTNKKVDFINLLRKLCVKRYNELGILLALSDAATNSKSTHELAIKLLSDAEVKIINNQENAENEIGNYLQCARIANKVSLEEGNLYFQKAIESASQIDIEAFSQIRALSELTEISSKEVGLNPELAYEFSRFTENANIRLNGYDHFPWESSIYAIENLDYATAMATWCKWEHKNYENGIRTYWCIRLKSALQKNIITPTQAASLTSLNLFDYQWGELIELLLQKLKADKKSLKTFLSNLLRDLQTICSLDTRKNWVDWLIPVLQREGIKEGQEVLKIKQFASFLSGIEKKAIASEEVPLYASNRTSKFKEDKKIEQLISNTDVCDSTSIEKALQKINEGVQHYTSFRVDEYLSRLKEKCSTKDQIKHLNALISINTKNISYHSFEEALSDRIKEWGHSQSVKAWKKEKFDVVLSKYLTEFYNADEEKINNINVHSINKLTSLFEKTSFELALTFKEILKDKISLFTDDAIYQSIYIFRNLLTPKQASEVIDWALKKWNSNLNPKVGEGEWNNHLSPSNDCVTLFLRYCLGHPYKNIRWYVLHVLKRLVQFGDKEILSNLIKYRNDLNNGAFQYSKHTYFSMSSKLWLFMALDRISREFPEALIAFADVLYEEATQKENAHILIRKLAKSAALNILKHKPSIYSKEQVTNLKNVLETQFAKKASPTRHRKGLSQDYVKRFKFDDLDTVGYWYDELGRLFGISGNDIAQIAEKYICDLWGFNGDVIKENHVKVPDYEYYLTSNNHGSIPAVEDLQNYYEYHAMFYVANELLETIPIINEEHLYRNMDEWMDKWCTVWNNHWLADLRDETPWEIDFWRSDDYLPYYTENWIYNIQSKDFDSKLHTNSQKNSEEGDWLVVAASYGRHWRNDHEDVYVTSSLVNTDKSRSLLFALQTVSNPVRFKLPVEDEDRMEFEESGFSLKGWIRHISYENEGEDSRDNYAYYLNKTFTSLGEKFIDWAGLTITSDYRFGFNRQNKLITKFENWSDFNDHSRHPNGFGSKGYRLLVKKEVLLSFLKENKCSLILECKVNRHLEKDYSSNKEEDNGYGYMANNFKIFLIHSDGSTETINSRSN